MRGGWGLGNSAGPGRRRTMVARRKFCPTTSACATSLARTSRPTSFLMWIDSERLPRFEEMNSGENSPALSIVARLRRVMSPPTGSILSTSAPWSARNIVANGPDTTPVKSSTRTSLSGPDIVFFLSCLCAQSKPNCAALLDAQICAPDVFIRYKSFRLARELHATLTKDIDVVRQTHREMIILFDQQDGDSRHLDILKHFFERLDDDGRKPLAGFIQDHQIGSGH